MAATVITPTSYRKANGTYQVVIAIPTTVDGTDGASALVEIPGPVRTLTGTATSSNFNGKTLSVKASNDGVTFTAVATAISVGSSGNFVIAAADIGFRYYQVLFSGAPTAALTVTLVATLLN